MWKVALLLSACLVYGRVVPDDSSQEASSEDGRRHHLHVRHRHHRTITGHQRRDMAGNAHDPDKGNYPPFITTPVQTKRVYPSPRRLLIDHNVIKKFTVVKQPDNGADVRRNLKKDAEMGSEYGAEYWDAGGTRRNLIEDIGDKSREHDDSHEYGADYWGAALNTRRDLTYGNDEPNAHSNLDYFPPTLRRNFKTSDVDTDDDDTDYEVDYNTAGDYGLERRKLYKDDIVSKEYDDSAYDDSVEDTRRNMQEISEEDSGEEDADSSENLDLNRRYMSNAYKDYPVDPRRYNYLSYVENNGDYWDQEREPKRKMSHMHGMVEDEEGDLDDSYDNLKYRRRHHHGVHEPVYVYDYDQDYDYGLRRNANAAPVDERIDVIEAEDEGNDEDDDEDSM